MRAVAEAVCDCLAGSLCVALNPGEAAPDLRVLLALLELRARRPDSPGREVTTAGSADAMTTSPRSSAFVAPADSRRRAWRTLVELVHTRPTPWLTLVDACNKRQAPWKTLVAICHDPLRRCLAPVANRHDPLRRCLALVANRHDPLRRCLALVANRHDPLQRCLALVASVNDPQRRCLALVASVNDPLPWRSRPWPRARGPPAADGRRTPLADKPKPTRRTRTCQNPER
jgi:hypothetical protein